MSLGGGGEGKRELVNVLLLATTLDDIMLYTYLCCDAICMVFSPWKAQYLCCRYYMYI